MESIHDIKKKRGRKPKGGKITEKEKDKDAEFTSGGGGGGVGGGGLNPYTSESGEEYVNEKIIVETNTCFTKPNIILHLKCFKSDLSKEDTDIFGYGSNIHSMPKYNNFCGDDNTDFDGLTSFNNEPTLSPTPSQTPAPTETIATISALDSKQSFFKKRELKELNSKLKLLEYNLHSNHMAKTKSACFWCTCDFDSHPIHIPKNSHKEKLEVYGWFCCPECATGYLMNEPLDSSSKFERYSLLNHMYASLYGYETRINPAPNPLYLLDKFMGNLSIEEYRTLCKSKTVLIKIDKPITHILPEYHEDNDEIFKCATSTHTHSLAPLTSSVVYTTPMISYNMKKSKMSSLSSHFYNK